MNRLRALITLGLVLVAATACKSNVLGTGEGESDGGTTRDASTATGGDAATTGTDTPQIVEGTYYGACLTELAFDQPNKVFNFWVKTRLTTATTTNNATLEMTLQPLEVENASPPMIISQSGAVGVMVVPPPVVLDSTGAMAVEAGPLLIPGTANPISGSDVIINSATLDGKFGQARFCARLGGELTKPEAAARTLDPSKNICQFLPIKDGDPRPAIPAVAFSDAACPR